MSREAMVIRVRLGAERLGLQVRQLRPAQMRRKEIVYEAKLE